MRGTLHDLRASRLLFIGVWVAYMATCMTRNTYSAAISAIVADGLFTKSATGVISAAFYLFYGGGQFIGGYLSDKISPIIILTIGMVGSAATNLAMSMSESYTVLLVAWSINGVCQFGVWPATLKIVAGMLHVDHRKKALQYISMCMCIGGVGSYLAAMVLLELSGWQSLFFFSSMFMTAVIVLWLIITLTVRRHLVTDRPPYTVKVKKQKKSAAENLHFVRLMATSGFFVLLIPSTLRCMLDNGVKSWVPTMMQESCGITADTSSLIMTLVVLINVSGVFIAGKLYPKYIKNVTVATAVLFMSAIPIFALILLIDMLPLVAVALLLIVSTTLMYSINQLINIEVPAAFSRYELTGTTAGIANAFGSFGVMLGNFVYGLIADASGWSAVVLTWVILAVVSALCCMAVAPLWKRFTM